MYINKVSTLNDEIDLNYLINYDIILSKEIWNNTLNKKSKKNDNEKINFLSSYIEVIGDILFKNQIVNNDINDDHKLADDIWNDSQLLYERNKVSDMPSQHEDGYLYADVSNGIGRLIMTMAANDCVQRTDRIKKTNYGNLLGKTVGKMHEIIQKKIGKKAIYLYQIATIIRMAIYYVQILTQIDQEPCLWFNKDVCDIINKYYNTYKNKLTQVVKDDKNIIFVPIIVTGVWTLSNKAIRCIYNYENIIVNITDRMPKNIIPTIYCQRIEEDIIIFHSEILNRELLNRSKYWSDIITEKGYYDQNKYLQSWYELSEKYHTYDALVEYIVYILHNPEKAKYLDLGTHCYLYGVASGKLLGPDQISISILNKVGIISLYCDNDTILLIRPSINYFVTSKTIYAVNVSENIYHVIGFTDISVQITKRANPKFIIK